MKLWPIPILAMAVWAAAPTITSGPVLLDSGYSYIRVAWTTNLGSDSYIRWDTATHPTCAGYPNRTGNNTSLVNTVDHDDNVSDLPAGGTIYWRAASATGGSTTATEEVCSAEFITNLPAAPALPEQPTPPAAVDETMPTQAGEILAVGANCDDGSTGLLARWGQASWGDTIEIPITTSCVGHYVFPAKTADTNVPHRWIVIRSANQALLPPPGTRISQADALNMPKIRNNRIFRGFGTTLSLLASLKPIPGEYQYVADDGRAFHLYQARPTGATCAISAVTSVTPLRATCAAHGRTTGDWVRITGVGGQTRLNQDWETIVIDSNTLELWVPGMASSGGGYGAPHTASYTSGGTIQKLDWVQVPFTSGSSLPASCAINEWFLLSSDTANYYMCTQTNVWGKFEKPNTGGYVDSNSGAVLDFGTFGVSYLRLIGLDVAGLELPPDPYYTFQRTVQGYRGSHGYLSLISVFRGVAAADNHHIVIDRCYIHGYLSPGFGQTSHGIDFSGSHLAAVDSLFYGIHQGAPNAFGSSGGEASALFLERTPRVLLRNNGFEESPGITVYWPSSHLPTLDATRFSRDVTIVQNDFFVSECWRIGTVCSYNLLQNLRHHLEFKGVDSALVGGNSFQGTYGMVNQAAAIAITPRSESTVIISVAAGTATCTRFGQSSFCGLGVGEKMFIDSGATALGIFTVASAPTANTMTFVETAPAPGTYSVVGLGNTPQTSNIEISNNYFNRNTNGIFLTGNTDGSGFPKWRGTGSNRIKVHNNLFDLINNDRCFGGVNPDGDGGCVSIANGGGGGLGGYVLYIGGAVRSLQVTDNTTVDVRNYSWIAFEEQYSARLPDTYGTNPANNRTWNRRYPGLWITGNLHSTLWTSGTPLVSLNANNQYLNSAALTAMVSPRYSSVWERNLVAYAGGALPGGAQAYPSGSVHWDLSVASLPYVAGSAKLKTDSTAAAYGLSWPAFDAARGVTVNLFAAPSTTSAIVSWFAPSSIACMVELGGIRTSSNPGSRSQSVTLTGLASSADYTAKLFCGGRSYFVPFRTL
jgi:hypothetical protein